MAGRHQALVGERQVDLFPFEIGGGERLEHGDRAPAARQDEARPAARRDVVLQAPGEIAGKRGGESVRSGEAVLMPHATGSAQLLPSRAISTTDCGGPHAPAL